MTGFYGFAQVYIHWDLVRHTTYGIEIIFLYSYRSIFAHFLVNPFGEFLPIQGSPVEINSRKQLPEFCIRMNSFGKSRFQATPFHHIPITQLGLLDIKSNFVWIVVIPQFTFWRICICPSKHQGIETAIHSGLIPTPSQSIIQD